VPIDYPAVLDLKEQGRRFSWSERDTMLYALAIGMGSDPLDVDELPFVHEKNLRAVPTLATVVAWGAGIPPERPTRLQRFAVRFSAPVFPGDRIVVRLWKVAGEVSFEADVPARGATVIRNGNALVKK
jgi:MaoC like domain